MSGWLVGGLLGLWSPLASMAVSAIALLLVGAPWAVSRIGGAGLGAALLGLTAAIGAGIEAHRAFVAIGAEVVGLPSLSALSHESGVVAVRVPRLHHRWALGASLSRTVRFGKNTRHVAQTAVPLAEDDGRVVGFSCGAEGSVDGAYALSLEAWLGSAPELCPEVIARSTGRVVEAGLPIAPGASQRVVRVFDSEAGLRGAHRLDLALAIPGAMFVVYAALVVLLRKHGGGAPPSPPRR